MPGPAPDIPSETPQDNLNELILYARQGDLESYQEATQIVLDRNPEFTDLAHVLTAVNSHGATALHMASANGHIDILKFLLERLPTDGVNQANSEGNTALHWAAMSGKVESVRLLLQHQADPMIKNAAGKTAITEAQQSGHEAVVSFLLENVDDSKIEFNMDDE